MAYVLLGVDCMTKTVETLAITADSRYSIPRRDSLRVYYIEELSKLRSKFKDSLAVGARNAVC
jgi:hypothetical protein